MFLNFEWVFVQVNLMLRPGFLIHGSFRFIYQRKQDLRQKQNNWQCIKRIEARKGILLKNITYLPVSYTHLDVYKRQVLMGMDIPLPAIRQQISSAIDIIVHLGRLRDRSRKVLEICEVGNVVEGEIEVFPIFTFCELGEEEGRILGTLERTGHVLCSMDKCRRAGVNLS